MKNECPLKDTSKVLADKIVIREIDVRAHSKDQLQKLKLFTEPGYEKFLLADPGKEHYTLFHYLTKNFHFPDDCRHVVDIGTRYVASALALGATGGVTVKTFDLPSSTERTTAFRGKNETEWQAQLKKTGNVNIEFYNLELLKLPQEDFQRFMSTWLIVIDTFHEPYSVPFEREFLDRLVKMKPKFEGLVLLDDINFNDEMKKWWEEINAHAEEWGYTVHDLTSMGHYSGTGLLDFSRKVQME